MNLFVYGSLMYPEVWSQVVTDKYNNIPATVTGWRRLAIKDREYPAAVRGAGSISGVVWLQISDQDLLRLDQFEGKEYEKETCDAISATGDTIEAYIYKFREEYSDSLLDSDWDIVEFNRIGLKKFMSEYPGFNDIYV